MSYDVVGCIRTQMPAAGALPVKKKQEPKCKLKQVHWVKVNERKLKDTIWEKMKDEEVDIDKDELEKLFAMRETGKGGLDKKDPSGADEGDDLVGPNGQRKKRVVILLSANRSQTIGVLLSHLKVNSRSCILDVFPTNAAAAAANTNTDADTNTNTDTTTTTTITTTKLHSSGCFLTFARPPFLVSLYHPSPPPPPSHSL